MDEPQSLAELIAVDDLTLHYRAGGFTGALLEPEQSLSYLRHLIGQAQIVGPVPETVRENFQRVRRTFLQGLLEFDLFTVASDLSRLVLEGALRVRFLTYYSGEIQTCRAGEAALLATNSFDAVRKARFDKYMLRDGDATYPLPITMNELLAWARRKHLLDGQRSMISDQTMTRARHHAAHPTGFHRGSPVDAARTIGRVAEYINKLWGASTPGGRVFPGPIERVPRAVAVSPDGCFAYFTSVRNVRDADEALRRGTYAVYLAAETEELSDFDGDLSFRHRPGFQRTAFPCDLLWGPGPWSELQATLPRLEDPALRDRVDHLDRIFIVRADSEQVDDPRSPDDYAACKVAGGRWHVVRADVSHDALRHVREHPRRPSLSESWCADCHVTEVGCFEDRPSVSACLEALASN